MMMICEVLTNGGRRKHFASTDSRKVAILKTEQRVRWLLKILTTVKSCNNVDMVELKQKFQPTKITILVSFNSALLFSIFSQYFSGVFLHCFFAHKN